MRHSNKDKALAHHLDIQPAMLTENQRQDYDVLTDSEADEKAKAYILESVWAFRPEFLAAHLKDGIDIDVVKAIQGNEKYEDNNKAILSIIDDVDHFVSEAIACDGRGHFLSSYDGEEHEVTIGKVTYYIYRTN